MQRCWKTLSHKKNQAMIDHSDYCLFYYDKNYLPPKRKLAKRDLFAYQPNSGNALAYKYALQKKKCVHNFFIYIIECNSFIIFVCKIEQNLV